MFSLIYMIEFLSINYQAIYCSFTINGIFQKKKKLKKIGDYMMSLITCLNWTITLCHVSEVYCKYQKHLSYKPVRLQVHF